MAIIKPINGWRYNMHKMPGIDHLISPLDGQYQKKDLDKYYNIPYNSIHLNKPVSTEQSAQLLESWKKQKVLVQDMVPGIYTYYQYIPDGSVVKGFICNMHNHAGENVVAKHEQTFSNAVDQLFHALKATAFNAGPIHGLYTDPQFKLEKWLDESIREPVYESTDHQGIKNKISIIHDKNVIHHFIECLADKNIMIADGHHRYESAIRYNEWCRKNNPAHNGNEGYNYHFIFLSNTEQKTQRILPYHRLIKAGNPGREQLTKAFSQYFQLKEEHCDIHQLKPETGQYFTLITRDTCYSLIPRKDILHVNASLSDHIIAYFLLHETLKTLLGKEYNYHGQITYTESKEACINFAKQEQNAYSVLLNPLSMEEFKKISHAGILLPQKTTYFYPKVTGGYLFNSIKHEDFDTPFNSCF